MKKFLLSSILLTVVFMNASAQEIETDVTPVAKNEIKINALFLVLGAFDVTYERILSEESAVGVDVFLPFDNDIKDEIRYYVSPYYRFYFGKKYASGFFLEGFGMLNNSRVNEIIYFNDQAEVTSIEDVYETDFALGIGLGGKWITNSGFIGEVNAGIGRNLFGSNEYEYNELVGKFRITVGYRF